MKILSRLILIFGLPLFITSCACDGSCREKKDGSMVNEANSGEIDETKNKVDEVVDKGIDMVDSTVTASATLVFEEGSWGWTLEDFLSNGTGTKVFNLDEVTGGKDEEISAEGKAQLDALAQILNTHPDIKAEVQAHTKKANNPAGKAAKKTGSAARALWVKTKLTARGVDKDQLTSKGYADEMLIEGVDGKDESQRRVSIAFIK